MWFAAVHDREFLSVERECRMFDGAFRFVVVCSVALDADDLRVRELRHIKIQGFFSFSVLLADEHQRRCDLLRTTREIELPGHAVLVIQPTELIAEWVLA